MKKLIKLVVLLLILIVGGAVAAYIYIDVLAKTAIERGSTYALGVNTTLKSTKLKVFDGQLILGGLNVANPQGYKTPHFLTLEDGDVAVSLASLRDDVVHVPHLRLSDIDVNLEKKEGKANYQVILDNLKGSETTTQPPAEEGKRYIVEEITVKNVKVHLDSLGIVGAVNLPIDEIQLRNVGSETSRGVLLKDLAGVIVKAIFAAIVEKGGGLIPDDITGELKSGLSQLTDLSKLADVEKLGDVIKDVGKPLDEATKDLGSLGDKVKEDVGKAIGDLLGGKKEE